MLAGGSADPGPGKRQSESFFNTLDQNFLKRPSAELYDPKVEDCLSPALKRTTSLAHSQASGLKSLPTSSR